MSSRDMFQSSRGEFFDPPLVAPPTHSQKKRNTLGSKKYPSARF